MQPATEQPSLKPLAPLEIRRVAVVLNPAAGRGQGRRRRGELEALLAEAAGRHPNKPDWEIIETTASGTGSEVAARAAAAGADIVAAVGGDGTYGEVVNGLVGTPARLGIIPLGTGNDFARGMGLGTDIRLAVYTLFHGVPRPIDLGLSGGRWFINVAGCGFDAVVAERVNRGFRRLRGTAAYIAAVYQCLLAFRPAAMRITIDGETHELRAMLCSIANSESYGGGMRIAPDAKIDDGWFDVCILGDAGRWEFIRAFPRVFKGTHVTHPKVTMLKAKHIRVESERPLPVLIDGEVIGTTPVEFEMRYHAIEVMGPKT
jgi:diacylglycerol kinase (ATP)